MSKKPTKTTPGKAPETEHEAEPGTAPETGAEETASTAEETAAEETAADETAADAAKRKPESEEAAETAEEGRDATEAERAEPVEEAEVVSDETSEDATEEVREHAAYPAAETAEAANTYRLHHEEADEAQEDEQVEEHEEQGEEHEDHEEHERHPTIAGRVLTGLIIFLVGAAVALWAAPRVAPHLPAGIAAYLETGSTVSGADLEAVRKDFDARLAAMESKMLSVATVTDLVDTRLAPLRQSVDGKIGELSDKIAATDSAAVQKRLAALENTVAGLDSQLKSLNSSLTDVSKGAEGLSKEEAARLAGFASKVDGLSSQVTSLSEQTAALSKRLDEVSAASERRVKQAEEQAEEVKAKARSAMQGMALTSALDEIQVALNTGAPYAEKLQKVADGAKTPPPEALSAPAETGVPTLAALRAAFPDAAHKAISAAVEADAGNSMTGQLSAWLRGQFTGLPVTETAGDDPPAILSRVNARLAEGDLDAALAEAKALPPAAAEALAPWRKSAEARRDAVAGLASWRAALTADG